ncbi:aminopeptidase [uncultured Anaerovibrio sp.]|uniref:aminopeptidase n=1 Tax=uncultured Anaerovibrio sp. TaxID=361586 RepID=UPI002634DA8A|nr:aminopeptidase [uncultured Anaerovibrio sp.]
MDKLLNKYAKLVVKTGVNLQRGQLLVINSPIECADFARRVAKAGFEAGCSDVKINWSDEKFSRIRFDGAANEIFDEFPQYRYDMFMSFKKKGAAIISIHASDPSIFKGVEQDKLRRAQMAAGQALLEYRGAIMNNELRWCVVSIPTPAWASKVFKEAANEEEAVAKLWQAIFKAVRIDEDNDPIEAWNKHTAFMKRATDFLNGQKLVSLYYRNGLGTDLMVKLPKGHIWAGGAEIAADKVEFVANMPTEEVYSLPDRNGVDGVVYASKPLIYQGNVIDGIRLVFKEGKVVEYSAAKGQDVLKQLLDTDEGAKHLGEVALVPYDSPISNSGILFYNTLFDENAACHLAFGKAYPTCLEGGDGMDTVELLQHGVNDSLVHEDFMIGTEDMEIVGTKADGSTVQIFTRGNFVEF